VVFHSLELVQCESEVFFGEEKIMTNRLSPLLLVRVPDRDLANPAFQQPDHMDVIKDYYRVMALELREAILEDEASGRQLLKYVLGVTGENRWNFVYMVIALFSSDNLDNTQDKQREISELDRCFHKPLCIGTVEIIRSGEWGNVRAWLESKKS
jgi:hypothetical protein